VLSMRNLRKLRGIKVFLSLILALTSLPIHLVFNSAVFTADSTTNYSVALVNQRFLDGGSFTITQALQDRAAVIGSKPNNPGTSFEEQLAAMQRIFARDATSRGPAQFEILRNRECIDAYGNGYTSGRSLLLLFTNETNADDIHDTVFWWDYAGGTANDHTWICNDVGGSPCDVTAAAGNATRWTVHGMRVDHCVSKLEEEHCKLQFSTNIMYAVIVMNMLKVMVMLVALYWRSDPALVTVGDGIASFLDEPDATTAGRCLVGYRETQKGPLRFKGIASGQTSYPVTYVAGGKQRWHLALGTKYWKANIGVFVIAIVAAGILLVVSAVIISPDLPRGQSAFSFRNWKGDRPTAHLVLHWLHQGPGEELVAAVVLANMPQFVVSCLYLAYNGIFTCMLQCYEYSQFGAPPKKPLRVTTPKGKQREHWHPLSLYPPRLTVQTGSTYFLSLPYRYSLPLMAASLLLHWLVSQSFFLARIDSYGVKANGEVYYQHSSSQIGYSCLPILVAILLALAFLGTLFFMSMRVLATDIPIVASCSAAIAAACHRPEKDVDAAYLPVWWGEVIVDSRSTVGHCCFTNTYVKDLTNGRSYA
jgi:hypothetical protein